MIDMKLTCTAALQSAYHCRVNKCYLHVCRVNCQLIIRLPGDQVLIYPAAGPIGTCCKLIHLAAGSIVSAFYFMIKRNNHLNNANVVDPDQTPRLAVHDPRLHCLLMS